MDNLVRRTVKAFLTCLPRFLASGSVVLAVDVAMSSMASSC